jgi:hypothetical protein
MRLQIFEFKCEPSGHEFRAPELPLGAYGEFLLRAEEGTALAYLNALADPTYKEVGALLEKKPGMDRATPNRRAEILRHIYGAVACDPDSGGRPFKIGQRPTCPVCSSSTMRSWQEVYPAEYIDLDVPPVTHRLWQSLSEEQKATRIHQWTSALN